MTQQCDILIVENDPADVARLQDLLETHGYKVVVAPDVMAARQMTGNRGAILVVDSPPAMDTPLSTCEDIAKPDDELLQARLELNRKTQLLDEAFDAQRHADQILKETQSQLIQSEKMAGLGQLVAGIAHEINNPLAFVSNNVAILQRDLSFLCQILDFYKAAESGLTQRPDLLSPIVELSRRIDLPYTVENLTDVLKRSHEGLRRIQQIVMDLRDFARLEKNTLKEADLNAGIVSTINIIRPIAKDRQVRIELNLQPLPLFSCFPIKINQVVMNLVANAIDASSRGSKVIVRSAIHEGEVCIEVIDQGVGIDKALCAKIFDPFYTTKPPGKGTGLGLSISYGIVKEHGGRIQVESEAGAGSHFTICLPLHPQDASGNPGATSRVI